MNHYIATLCEMHKIQYISSNVVGGGDISSSYAVDTNIGRIFLKLNSAARYPQMFTKEAEGLHALQQVLKLKIPVVISTGVYEDQQYLFMQWLDKTQPSLNFWNDFAEALAQLHSLTNKNFGWSSSNYIGSLVQQNDREKTWAAFYASQRIMPLVKKLFDANMFSISDVRAAEKISDSLKSIFPNEPPALLHGDLWAGNFMAAPSIVDRSTAVPSLFDPAVYYGHREMDIGMSLLFGGFDNKFYAAYNAVYPLEKNWRKRVSLTQFYPLLVHAVLFGASYVNRCRNILHEWN